MCTEKCHLICCFCCLGRSDCPYFARCELLGDCLAKNLKKFRLHKIVIQPEQWEVRISKKVKLFSRVKWNKCHVSVFDWMSSSEFYEWIFKWIWSECYSEWLCALMSLVNLTKSWHLISFSSVCKSLMTGICLSSDRQPLSLANVSMIQFNIFIQSSNCNAFKMFTSVTDRKC